MGDGLTRKVEEGMTAVMSRMPTEHRAVLLRLWGGRVKIYVVERLACLGSCSDDGLTIAVSSMVAALPLRGLQLVLAHEIAHACQVATGQVVDDIEAMERGAERIMHGWGYHDEQIEFWVAYAKAPKHAQRRMKGEIMRKDEDLMRTFAKWRSEKGMVAA
jgi:hypothetical protein